MELRHEEKLFGNKLSFRQVLYLGGGIAGIGAAVGLAYVLNKALGAFAVPTIVHDVIWGLGGVLALVPLIGSLMLAFVPALGVWRIPGPSLPMDDDGFSPPIRLDQWWGMYRAHKARTPILAYRRTRALAGEGFTFLEDAYSAPAPTANPHLTWDEEDDRPSTTPP